MSSNNVYHMVLDPASRRARLLFCELAIPFQVKIINPKQDAEKLLALNPAAQLPVVHMADGLALLGSAAIEGFVFDQLHSDPDLAKKLPNFLPQDPGLRAEIRRLCSWISEKLALEAVDIIVFEKITKQAEKIGQPDPAQLRIAKTNLAVHVAYFSYLLDQRRWLAGDELSLADFYLTASMSILDYLGEIEWAEHTQLKNWYAIMKSRPSMRDILQDRWVGMLPVSWYDNLDF